MEVNLAFSKVSENGPPVNKINISICLQHMYTIWKKLFTSASFYKYSILHATLINKLFI